MSDELDCAAERVRKALYDMPEADFIHIEAAHEYGDGLLAKESCRVLAAAALANTGWRDIKDAPLVYPEHGYRVGSYECDGWHDYEAIKTVRPRNYRESGYTHFRLNAALPPKPETAP